MPEPRVLIYSATAGYRHDSIPTAIAAIQTLGSQHNILFDNTEDKSKFQDSFLAQYDALFFLSNSDEVLDQDGKDAFQRYLDAGGNYIGVHSASTCLMTTDFYNRTVGALFDYHPDLQNATVVVEDADHPSTSSLPTRWEVQDEMYNFRSDPRGLGAVVLLSADESTYIDNGTRTYNQGSPHPIAWYQEHLAGTTSMTLPLIGRSWYTGLGHLSSTWGDETFLSHILGGITWTLAANTTRAFNPNGNVGNTGTDSTISSTQTGSSSAPAPSRTSSGATNKVKGGIVASALGALIALTALA